MKNVTLLLLLFGCSVVASAQQSGQSAVRKGTPPRAMCSAAAGKLRESETNEVVLTMTLDSKGKVQSFRTESPKGLRLEENKEAAAAINALQFHPAQKDGRAVRVMVRVEFDCSEPASDACPDPNLGQAKIEGDTMDGLVEREGKPLKLAQIRVYSSSSGKTVWVWRTDDDGRFTSQKLPPGSYRVEISGWGSTTVVLDPKSDSFAGQTVNWSLEFLDNGCVGTRFNTD